MGKKGGTQMHCPKCKCIRVCRAIPTNEVGKKSGQRWYKTDHPDINWFRRGRQCLKCSHRFLTSEINEKYLDELVELREALSNIKKHSEQYIEESDKASTTLKDLSSSLSVLRALKIYKNTK
jgi:transcriptional regulator NrdR family protein